MIESVEINPDIILEFKPINPEFDLGHSFKSHDTSFEYSIIRCRRCSLLLMHHPKFEASKYRMAFYVEFNREWYYYSVKKILTCDEMIIQNIID